MYLSIFHLNNSRSKSMKLHDIYRQLFRYIDEYREIVIFGFLI